ncbi:MAG TPA: aryl-sulfate sulfotransferase, partial [Catalimonadaceae bacterium]|nr:aryl-sulfate sulfotransferase [Catalimonadaceae bacterium]
LSLFCLCSISFNLFAQKYGKYTLYSVMNSTTTQLIDTNNVVFKTWTHAANSRTGYSSYLMPGGILWRSVSNQGNQLNGGGITGKVQKLAWDGTILWDYTYSTSTYVLHHDICPLPNGNVLLISYDVHTPAEATQAGASQSITIWSEKIIEVQPTGATTGNIVWQWRAWDHLVQNVNPAKDNYQASIVQHPERLNINYQLKKDWIHMNGLDYNPITDQIAFSSHYLNEWYVIDHSTTMAEAAGTTGGNSDKGGDLLFRWGNPAAYQATGTKILNVTHDAHWIPEGVPNAGRLVGFNNGGITAPSNKSTVDMVMPPANEYNFNHTAGQAFQPTTYDYRHPCNGYSTNMGNSQQLPNGNMLVCVATTGSIYEINSAGTTIWSKNGGGVVPQAFRYSECYVNSQPEATPTISAQGSVLTCSPAATYQWYRNGVKIDGATQNSYTTVDQGVYVVRVTYATSCEAVFQYSAGYKVVATFPLSVTATATLSTICAGENVQINAVATGGSATNSYQWTSQPAGFSSSIANPIVNPSVSTVYKVLVTNGSEVDSATISITVNPLPATPTITQNVNDLTSTIGNSYQWTFNGTIQPGLTSQTISPTQNGVYRVQISDQNGCKSEFSDPIDFIYTGVSRAISNLDVKVYPNPSTGIFAVSGLEGQSNKIMVMDAMGRIIFS